MKTCEYFDKVTFSGLVLIMPSTIIVLSILLRALNSEALFGGLFDIKEILNPYTVMNVASLLSLIICFTDIVRINSKTTNGSIEERFIYQKSFLDLAIIFVNICYIIFIYLYYDLIKFGNIPVGRD